MLCFVCNRISLVKFRALPFSHGFSFIRPMSEMSSFTDPQNFTVSYLQNSCGFSLNSAILVSKKLLIQNPERADSVLKLMRTQGLTKTQIEKFIGTRPALLLSDLEGKLRPNLELLESLGIFGASLRKLLSKEPRLLYRDTVDTVEFFRGQGFSDKQLKLLIMKRPELLMFNTNKVLKPKLEFLKSIGFTEGDVAKFLSSDPYMLGRSLENYLIPCFQLLRRVLGTKENVVKAVKADTSIFRCNLEKILEPNILIFKSHGVPEPIISKMFMWHPRTLLSKPQRTKEILAEVVKLGFDPNTMLFVLAFRTLALISKTLWERKLEAYKSFGLSEDQVYSAFKLQPMCMSTSEKKIKKLMNFFINKLNVEPSVICRYPSLLLLSLEKRIIPRCSVLQLLMSKGLIKEDVRLFNYFIMSKEKFVEQVMRKYHQVVPDILKAHEGKIEFQGFVCNI